MQPSLEDNLIKRVTDSRDKVAMKIYKEFVNSKTSEERELVHAKTVVLKDLTFSLINAIRGNNDG